MTETVTDPAESFELGAYKLRLGSSWVKVEEHSNLDPWGVNGVNVYIIRDMTAKWAKLEVQQNQSMSKFGLELSPSYIAVRTDTFRGKFVPVGGP